ncbi:MAG: leucine--tRNA ligase [Dehalococcoidia bacterium]|nr:Leucine--tRNA ligase [Chloroflexota bacterium]MBT9159853.1 Leucine--tRNA ligase [Chloroflexota bacterium]MBT9162189.1 Leucine--tRNA ligase [Chloroflexota bacterium]
MTEKYNPPEIEKKWQSRWEKTRLYATSEDSDRPKLYELTMFPYTSGDLHIGHWYAMAPADVHARFMRMKGYNVLHPMGFDAFGLPAENAAIDRDIHPHTWTMKNVENMRRQFHTMGAVYDWDREVVTCSPDYYRWTQWLFLKLHEAGLTYRAKAPANWCSRCQTVLANEQVTAEGRCERCGTAVIRKDLEQWFFRITRYADELMQHEGLDWPEQVKTMQRNWVGRSEGAEISFSIEEYGLDEKEIRVFTTRPDTTYGVTFMVLAPEHPLVEKLTSPEYKDRVDDYVNRARRQSEIERLSTERERTGLFIGAYATNRLNGEKVPIWIADYALLSYGTGAVMGVPAHDQRDFELAKEFGIPIKVVVAPDRWSGEELEEAYEEPGTMVNSGPFDGQPSEEGKDAIVAFMEENGYGKKAVSYRLRDWLISRQRYWGAPIPMVHCPRCGIVPVPEKDLPVLLPEDAEFKPTGESPLKYCEPFVNTTCPRCGKPAQRETDTMDTFVCSSWYFLRYCSPQHDDGPFDPQRLKYWLPVDLYTGGVEHATMHLLYARFFIKALRDMGIVDFGESFIKLFNQGKIIRGRQKMSKSRGNVVNPDEYVAESGADAMRAYLMFIGPWEQGGEWNDNGLIGITRWLNRIWNLVLAETEIVSVGRGPCPDTGEGHGGRTRGTDKELRRVTHQTIKKVNQDLERFHFNTMLAALMEFTNYLARLKEICAVKDSPAWKEAIDALLLLLAPAVPHLAEELWERTGHPYSIHHQPFPVWQEELVAEEEFTLVIQINGKVRDKVSVPVSISEAEVRELVLSRERIKAQVRHPIVRVIYVTGRLVNIVVK